MKWSIVPIDILNARTFLPYHYPHRIPITPLVQKYRTGEGGLFIHTKVIRDDANARSSEMPSSDINLIIFTPFDAVNLGMRVLRLKLVYALCYIF